MLAGPRLLNPMRVHSPRLAASSSYRRKPVSRRPGWIPCQARNDGREQETIPRGLPRGSSFARPTCRGPSSVGRICLSDCLYCVIRDTVYGGTGPARVRRPRANSANSRRSESSRAPEKQRGPFPLRMPRRGVDGRMIMSGNDSLVAPTGKEIRLTAYAACAG